MINIQGIPYEVQNPAQGGGGSKWYAPIKPPPSTLPVAPGSRALAAGAFASGAGADAVAFGTAASAAGQESVALGTSSSAVSSRDVAIGYQAVTGAGGYSVAIGQQVSSVSNGGVAIGYVTTASGIGAVAIGISNTVNDYGAFAVGYNSHSYNASGVAMGYAAQAGGTSLAVGYQAYASAGGGAYTAIAIGYQATCYGMSIVLGHGANSPDNVSGNSLVTGIAALGRNTSSRVHSCASESIATARTGQMEDVVRSVETSNATVTPASPIYVASSATLKGMVVARQTGGAAGTVGDTAGWYFEAVVKNIAGVYTIVGTNIAAPTAPTYNDAAAAAWQIGISTGGANNGVYVAVIGEANKNILWLIRVDQVIDG